jgi:hypothetical protein
MGHNRSLRDSSSNCKGGLPENSKVSPIVQLSATDSEVGRVLFKKTWVFKFPKHFTYMLFL